MHCRTVPVERKSRSLTSPACGRQVRNNKLLRTLQLEDVGKALDVSAETAAMRCWGTSGDGWHDTDGVAILCWRIFFCQITNIFVVYVYIHEAAQLAFFGEQMFAQVAELRGQAAEGFADRSGFDLG